MGHGHHGGRLVAEVLVIEIQGPNGKEVPQDRVGLTTADFSLAGEEHEVHLSFPIKLEAPKDPEHELLLQTLSKLWVNLSSSRSLGLAVTPAVVTETAFRMGLSS